MTLQTVSLLDPPRFNALSYCCGTDPPSRPVLLHGNVTLITANLESGLRQLRTNDVKDALVVMPLWVDALCISQEDVEERSQQVLLMREVYSQAAEVKVWLGDADDDTEFAIHCLRRIITGELDGRNFARTDLAIFKSEMIAVASLFRRRYWTRRWILQEQLLAKNMRLYCGQCSVSWSVSERKAVSEYHYRFFTNSASFPKRLGIPGFWKSIVDIIDAIDPVKSIYSAQSRGEDLPDWPWRLDTFLDDVATHECLRPHDIVYALLGILPNTDIIPDYSAPLATVLTDYVYRLMTESDQLNILYRLRSSDSTLPSWVPEMRPEVLKRLRSSERLIRDLLGHALYQCAAGHFATPFLQLERNMLCVLGFQLDSIAAIGTKHPNFKLSSPNQVQGNLPSDWWALYSAHCQQNDPELNAEGIENDLFRIYYRDRLSGMAASHAGVYSGKRNFRLTDDDVAECRADAYAEYPFASVGLKTFFVTQDGRAGMTHTGPQVGDCIFAIAGLGMPLILRKTDKADGHPAAWEKIAVCYLHGVMDGEAVIAAAGGDRSRVHEVFEDVLLV
ncbi:unnamed protein product [Zymoseptoria tritici ST99CH_1E4]|uniref:Heterokaryon incompatibility domain-containing protein n=1 Tax=Zymoseptoria tritici ST99CH_1E4 TaxID=1276532 RepID=A0A2H1FJG4_ZYMTR|nr:unnamed protein product [Zymoseptoria tritici ST99CH_1E4]